MCAAPACRVRSSEHPLTQHLRRQRSADCPCQGPEGINPLGRATSAATLYCAVGAGSGLHRGTASREQWRVAIPCKALSSAWGAASLVPTTPFPRSRERSRGSEGCERGRAGLSGAASFLILAVEAEPWCCG